MIRLLALRLRRRWLLHALDNVRQTMANAAESEQIFLAEVRRVQAEIAMAETERRFRVRA